MIITCEKIKNIYKIAVELEKDDSASGVGQGGADITLLHDTFTFELPFAVREIHPDLFTLAVLTVVIPWIGKKITLPAAVSPTFAEVVADVFGFQIENVDSTLQPRKKGDRESLAFSGGIDSIAASLVLPEDTVKCTFIRRQHAELPDLQSNYSIHATEKIVDHFDDTFTVYSDLEHIVGPRPQFPSWVVLSIPCILLADHFTLKSVSFGTVLGSAYFVTGKYRETDVPMCPDWEWRPLFAAAGLEISKPVAGLTEAGTFMITDKSDYKDIATSCHHGQFRHPCMCCSKCFRKYFIRIALNEEKPSHVVLDKFWQQAAIRNYMTHSVPLEIQHLFIFVFSRIRRSDLSYPFRLFRDKLMLNSPDIEWNARYYPEALRDYIPDPVLRVKVQRRIEKYIAPMNHDDIETVRSWNLSARYEHNNDRERDLDTAMTLFWDKQVLASRFGRVTETNARLQKSISEKEKDMLLLSRAHKQESARAEQILQVERQAKKSARQLLKRKREETILLKNSIRFRIGDTLALCMSSPKAALMLPKRLYVLFRKSRVRKNKRLSGSG